MRYSVHLPLGMCYGSLSLFTSILHNVFLLYHVNIFVSVYKIDKTSFWIGESIFLVWNSLNDPLFGWLSDSQYLTSGGGTTAGAKGRQTSTQIILRRLHALQWSGPLFALSFCTFWVSWTYPAVQFVVCLQFKFFYS
jgi:hypothetical protein